MDFFYLNRDQSCVQFGYLGLQGISCTLQVGHNCHSRGRASHCWLRPGSVAGIHQHSNDGASPDTFLRKEELHLSAAADHTRRIGCRGRIWECLAYATWLFLLAIALSGATRARSSRRRPSRDPDPEAERCTSSDDRTGSPFG